MFHDDCHIDTMATPRVHRKKIEFKPTPLGIVLPEESSKHHQDGRISILELQQMNKSEMEKRLSTLYLV